MDFKIISRQRENLSRYNKEDVDIVYEFSKHAKKELQDILKSIILFGSAARKAAPTDSKEKSAKSHDIDILLILDDVSIQMTPELIQAYRIITEKIIAKVSRKLHITTLRLTNFWEYVRAGDPVAINMLRDGVIIMDSGFFEPLQLLLYQGRIRPSAEAIQNYFTMAPQTLYNSKMHIIQACLDLYWAVIDAAHAALMSLNEIPPSPAHVADMLEEKMVKKGLIHAKYARIMRNFYHLGKSIMHNEITNISGDQYDGYYKEAHEFVYAMERFIGKK